MRLTHQDAEDDEKTVSDFENRQMHPYLWELRLQMNIHTTGESLGLLDCLLKLTRWPCFPHSIILNLNLKQCWISSRAISVFFLKHTSVWVNDFIDLSHTNRPRRHAINVHLETIGFYLSTHAAYNGKIWNRLCARVTSSARWNVPQRREESTHLSIIVPSDSHKDCSSENLTLPNLSTDRTQTDRK